MDFHFNKNDWDTGNVPKSTEGSVQTHGAICEDCGVALLITANMYECPSCGMKTEAGQWDAISTGANGGSIRFGNSRSQSSLYITKTDADKSKLDKLTTFLSSRWKQHWLLPGYKIPWKIIHSAAEEFIAIKPNLVDDYEGAEPKKHRRSRKYEILCALIKFIGNKWWILHDHEIAAFMGLETLGFSKGDNTVRMYAQYGVGNLKSLITVDDIPYEAYLNRYFEILNIDTPEHRGFVIGVVDLSIATFIGPNTRRSSKIAGAVWILKIKKNLKFTVAQLEACTGGTKKNTFCKFIKLVNDHKETFAMVFAAYNVPL